MSLRKTIQIILLCLSLAVFFYSYYYIPNKNEGFIKVKNLPAGETPQRIETKSTFTNVEYKSQNQQGQIFTTKAKASSFNLDKKKKNIIIYKENVEIKNKNYLITSNKAVHLSSENIIVISGTVVMKDLTMGLSHIIYCDKIEIDTITNNTVATMNSSIDKVHGIKMK